MKCLRKYQWVKLPRDIPDMGKGLMAYWAMLASRAAFRKGNASYCGHSNPVAPGMWAGGVVGLKSILGVRSRAKALQILDELSSLFFSFLFIKLTRFADLSPGGRCPVPVNLILDEFNNIGRIGGAPDGSDFCRSLSVIRSRDIRVMLAVQSLGQLQNRYPNNLWSEIIGNCDIQLMLGCTDDVTADYISDRSGEMCIVVDSTMTVKKTVAVTQVIPQYRETQGQGKRKLLTPDEVLRLPHEQMLVIIRGQNLLLLNKFDYTRHPMSKEMVRASIMDYCPRTSYAPTPQTGSENEPDKKPRRESRGRKLSRSDAPPAEF